MEALVILGVTGGIGSGKSTVSRLLQQLGAQVVSADVLAREVVAPGSAALQQLVRRFGDKILNEDGTLDRKCLGEIVFDDVSARRDLESVMHPAIAQLSQQRLQQAARSGALVVYEAPLLFEAGAENRVDKVLVVTIDEVLQLQRLRQRDGCDAMAAIKRIEAQMPQQEKVARADYVIDNSQGEDQLRVQVEALFAVLTHTK